VINSCKRWPCLSGCRQRAARCQRCGGTDRRRRVCSRTGGRLTGGPAAPGSPRCPRRSRWIPLLRWRRQPTTWPTYAGLEPPAGRHDRIWATGAHQQQAAGTLTRAAFSGTGLGDQAWISWLGAGATRGSRAAVGAPRAASAGDGRSARLRRNVEIEVRAFELGPAHLRVAGCRTIPPRAATQNLRHVRGKSVRAGWPSLSTWARSTPTAAANRFVAIAQRSSLKWHVLPLASFHTGRLRRIPPNAPPLLTWRRAMAERAAADPAIAAALLLASGRVAGGGFAPHWS